VCLTSHPGYPQEKDNSPSDQQDEWAPDGVWMFWREKSLVPAGNRTADHSTYNPVTKCENYIQISK